jgi:hypothetical protein
MTTEELVAGLLGLPEPSKDWSVAYRGRPINSYFLRDRFKGVIDAPEAERRWREAGPKARGYLRQHFDDAFERYLAADNDNHSVRGFETQQNFAYTPGDFDETSGPSGPEPINPDNSAACGGQDALHPDPAQGECGPAQGTVDPAQQTWAGSAHPWAGPWAGSPRPSSGVPAREIRQKTAQRPKLGRMGRINLRVTHLPKKKNSIARSLRHHR